MAEALVGGALLSGFINVVFDRLISPEVATLIKGKKLDQDLVERLKTALCGAEALLIDAEHKQFDNPLIRNWLESLKDAVYNADDSLDYVFTKAATPKKVSSSLPSFLNFKDKKMVNKMVNKIEAEVRRIEDLEKRKYILDLKEVARDNYSSWRTSSTSLVKGNIYGREDDQQAIMKIIKDRSEHQLSVIPIVGMGGVGKTTLAQWLYNNEDMMEFHLKSWVCISEEFDIVEVTKAIIEGITKSTCDLKDLNLLQLDLKEKLSTKKFFIVLDDVWSDDGDMWNSFRIPFQYGAKGSTIVVTTRSKEVASVVHTCAPYFLNELSDDYCWSVFADNACFFESNGNSALEDVGRKIVKKCNGLPLAAETLGRLLRTKHNTQEWNAVLMSDFWDFPLKNSKIIPALLISYNHLPGYLKGCFVYCSLFPKDHKFVKDDLILLWMAENLLRPAKGRETLEEVGNECFDNLASILFFKQHSDIFYGEYFLMHDLVHDLAMFIAGNFYCRLEELGKAERMSIQNRHLSYESLSHPISKNFDSIDKVESLRTFLQVNFSHPKFHIEHMPHMILSQLKYLRVLSCGSFEELDSLPDSIGKLIHLRYLDLSFSRIKTLPESLCGLYNLQTLKLHGCQSLIMLPNNMHYLLNLRHLDIRETSLQEMPKGVSKLKHLQFLGCFIVGRQKDSAGINELGELSNLAGTLELTKLENVSNCEEAMGARLMDKIHIHKLILNWSSSGDIVSDMLSESEVFVKLQPHHGLKELRVKWYMGVVFPNWVGHSSYHSMTHISLKHCKSCCTLPSLGQLPSLKYLHVANFDKLEKIGVEFYKNEDDHSSSASPFPSLEHLRFESMPCWEVWSPFDSNNPFPELKHLEIRDCPRLKGDIPNHLPALGTLRIEKCEQLVSSLPRAPTIQEIRIESDKVALQELPLSLQTLSVAGCQLVESMFRAMSINRPTRLQYITISNCLSATSLPWDCIPESLISLRIKNCRKLEFQCQQQQQKHKLEELVLNHSCDSLTLLQLEAFPKLNHLEIGGCENLESFSLSQTHHMRHFVVYKCKKLKSLPCHMNTLLPNLENLYILGCPSMDSFPEGGLPPSLRSLYVYKCERLMSNLSSMGVHQSLIELYIDGGECLSIKSFPNEGMLPGLPSLTYLGLKGFPNMETLECKQLLHLTSLQKLEIEQCPKLANIAGERLPHSLLQLQIEGCPLLAELCKKKHKQIWPKISHIRGIQVDRRWVS